MRTVVALLLVASCTIPSPNDIDCGGTACDPNGGSVADGDAGSGGDGNAGSTDGSIGNNAGSDGGPASDGSLSSGPIPIGGLCLASATPPETVDECAPGSLCILSKATRNVDVCHELCHDDPDCHQPTFPGGLAPACRPQMNASDPTLGACTISCNPVGAKPGTNGCSGGLACYGLLATELASPHITDCIAPGGSGEGGDCSAHGTADCAPGNICTGDGICHPVCLVNADCPPGESCTPFVGASGAKYAFCLQGSD